MKLTVNVAERSIYILVYLNSTITVVVAKVSQRQFTILTVNTVLRF